MRFLRSPFVFFHGVFLQGNKVLVKVFAQRFHVHRFAREVFPCSCVLGWGVCVFAYKGNVPGIPFTESCDDFEWFCYGHRSASKCSLGTQLEIFAGVLTASRDSAMGIGRRRNVLLGPRSKYFTEAGVGYKKTWENFTCRV